MSTYELYGNRVPRVLRLLGVFGIERGRRGTCVRCHWAELSWCFPKIALDLTNSDDDNHPWHLHVALLFVQAFIYLPLPRIDIKVGEMSRSWGFSWLLGREFGYGDVHMHWSYRVKIIHMPWHLNWVRSSYLLDGGKVWAHDLDRYRDVPFIASVDKGKKEIGRYGWADDLPLWSMTVPYRYVLKSGEVQDREATIRVEEREWRPWMTKFLPWPRKISRSIDVRFNGEVGERSGSWKGGTIGCGYEQKIWALEGYLLREKLYQGHY